jgi:predicted ATPase
VKCSGLSETLEYEDVVLIESLKLDGLLSFAPGTPTLELKPLNVVIGPNGSGKSNFIEAIELLHAAPTALASAVRDGGGIREWLWKGNGTRAASIDARLKGTKSSLRYLLQLSEDGSGLRPLVSDELLEEAERDTKRPEAKDVYFYYRFQNGRPVLNALPSATEKVMDAFVPNPLMANERITRSLRREDLKADESVLSQRKDPELYPELTWCGVQFSKIQTFREWSFGRYAELRKSQPADLPNDVLLPDARNLGLLINRLELTDAGPQLDEVLRRFLPRFHGVKTRVEAGTVQIFLQEKGLKSAVSATRLSDGTMRFLAMATLLLMPNPPPLICIDEPELGLHPDALSLIAELLLEARERTQLIVTTHSDALVSALTSEIDSVVVCENNGGTKLSRLDAGALDHWLDKYRLGDLWRMGELGGNP